LVVAWRSGVRQHLFLWVLLAAPIAGHVFWWTHGGNRYGPRFYFEALLPFTLLVGVGLDRVLSWRRGRALAWVGGVTMAAVLVVLSSLAWRQVHARRGLERTVAHARLSRAIVFVATASADLTRADLARNPPAFRGAPVLLAISGGVGRDRVVAAGYPEREVYIWSWDAASGGVLVPYDALRR
jgi:hypothetical protein